MIFGMRSSFVILSLAGSKDGETAQGEQRAFPVRAVRNAGCYNP